MTAPTNNRDELRQAVSDAIELADAQEYFTVGQIADAAIKAYERHRPPPTVVLTREEWAKARSIFVSGFWDESTESRVRSIPVDTSRGRVMGSDDDCDFTSAGGNYYQHGKITHKPLELPSVDWRARWREERDRAEKAEAERDEARARFNDKDLCLHGQAPCEDLLAAERTAYSAGWIAGRDAAAAQAHPRCWPSSFSHHDVTRAITETIRALTPPETRS